MQSDGRTTPLHYHRAWSPAAACSLYPVAGYAVWWQGLGRSPALAGLSQTVVAWSYFPGHGHKHADDMSVLQWADGHAWWSNVGYWPYELRGRAEAESWDGSNAPHLAGEPAKSQRASTLLSSDVGWP